MLIAGDKKRKKTSEIFMKSIKIQIILMDLSPQNIEHYKSLFPALKFEQSYGGCTAVTIRY